MAQTSNLKSASITNLDSIPTVANNTGEGAPAFLRVVDDYVTTLSGDNTTSTYKVVRIPSNAVVKSVKIENEAMSAGDVEVGLYYSDSTVDGTPVGVQGTVLNATFFATSVSLASAAGPTDVTNESGSYTLNLRSEPIWQAAGLTADPGGFLDIVLTVVTAGITTGARVGIRCDFAE